MFRSLTPAQKERTSGFPWQPPSGFTLNDVEMRGESEVPGGALNLIFTNYPGRGHHGRLPPSRKNAHGRAGNRSRDHMVSSQKL